MSRHPLYWLAFLTFIVVAGFAGWNLMSTRRRQKAGDNVSGLGGPNDPLR
jgi:hypothetical protein